MDRVFLDANVLFSAAYLPDSRITLLWSLPGVTLLSSHYAVNEATSNLALSRPSSISKLSDLLKAVESVGQPLAGSISFEVEIVEKDRPILESAIGASATHLLTGDRRHFGHLLGKTILGTQILVPSEYLQSRITDIP